MRGYFYLLLMGAILALGMISMPKANSAQTLRFATFNVSMEASNYQLSREQPLNPNALFEYLKNGDHPQIRNIAEIIQRVRPDVILLNEFDFHPDPAVGAGAFLKRYLAVPQQGAAAIEYPYFYAAPVNTGVPSPWDIDGDGIASGTGADAYGFGFYPGQYGMLLLSRYPINIEKIRTFQHFLWSAMPEPQTIRHPDGRPFYDQDTWQGLRLSSKSHWDVPIMVGDTEVHILAAHPTPPVFDGEEDRNGARNYDEIRLWADYISAEKADYLYDDKGQYGGLGEHPFVILGDYNASAFEGDSRTGAIEQLLHHPRVNRSIIGRSVGGQQHSPEHANSANHTAEWRAQVDYVLPSVTGLIPVAGGVFWPAKNEDLYRLVAERGVSSDHRLVWLDVQLGQP